MRTTKNLDKVLRAYQRARRTLSQTQIARESGASVQHVCDVEKGRHPPSGKLLAWLGWETGYLQIHRATKRGRGARTVHNGAVPLSCQPAVLPDDETPSTPAS